MALVVKGIEKAGESLRRIQEFQASTLVQSEKLGATAFTGAVEPANRLVNLFRMLPLSSLDQFPTNELSIVQSTSDSLFSIFQEILDFDIDAGDNKQRQTALIARLSDYYQNVFSSLFPLIAFSAARTVDFASLESRGRAAIQAINDDKERVLKSINETAEQAAKTLQEVREAAAEQGVTQMAKYFGDEADEHKTAAKNWLIASAVAAAIVVFYAVSTLFLYKWFPADDAFVGAQIITSKLLIFGVLLYGLFQCVRSYSAHRHNQVTNKHRQNALMTYKTLAEAGNSPELRDAVLQHAAAAIYAPNDSGYLKGEERGYGAQSLLALLPRNPGATTGSGAP